MMLVTVWNRMFVFYVFLGGDFRRLCDIVPNRRNVARAVNGVCYVTIDE